MSVLPEPPATTTGQATNPLTDAVMRAAVENTIHEWRRESTSPPEQRPSRPAMSQRATDASALMLSGSVASVLVGGAASLVMITSGHADPVVCGIVFGSPAALALAASRLLKRAKGVLPADITHNYTGDVHQETRITHTRAIWSKTNNQH